MDVTVIGIRNEKEDSEYLRDYEVSDLLDKVDILLTEHGFVRDLEEKINKKMQIRYRIYEGLKGKARVRFAEDYSKPILHIIDGKEEARCPIYIDLLQVPDLVEKSILKNLEKI